MQLARPIKALTVQANRIAGGRFSLDGIALDSLGSGYAGLASFTTLNPTFVKYDMSLVRGVDSSPTRRKVISAMTALFAETGVNVVAVGVETESECRTLVELGVDLMQGHLLTWPGPMSISLADG